MTNFDMAMNNLLALNRSDFCQNHIAAFRYFMENGYYTLQLEVGENCGYVAKTLGIYPDDKSFNKAITTVSNLLRELGEKGWLV